MSTYTVSTSTALVEALNIAKAGDIIALKAGTYDPVLIRGVNAGGVTITSADPNNPAVLTGLTIRDSSGINVNRVEMSTDKAQGAAPFLVWASSNIHFDALEVHGTPGLGSETTVDALVLRNSTNVSVTNSEFYDLRHAVGIAGNTGVTIEGNSFHDIRTDGIRGGGNSDVVISQNMFTDFYPAANDHADAIQLWTTGMTESARNITITDNLIVRGSGAPIQGIFIRDQGDKLPYYNVTVTGNMVLGGNHNGIALNGVVGGTITGNTVIGTEDHRSWIRVDESRNVGVTDNLSTWYMTEDATRDGLLAGNTLSLPYQDSGAAEVWTWLSQNSGFSGVWGTSADVMGALTLSMAQAQATLAAQTSYVTVEGTNGADKLKVKAGFDTHILAGKGDDSLTGGETGNHKLIGGKGDDTYAIKGIGDVVIEDANDGYDTVNTMIDYTLTANVEMLRLGTGGLTGVGNDLDNRIVGSSGDDEVFGLGGEDTIQGLDGDDHLSGGYGDDTIKGDGGDDTLLGGAGVDALSGGAGNDVIFGDIGNDSIEGGAGMDRMSGGAGSDVFRFRAGDIEGDVITDFRRGQDKIDLRGIDAKAGTAKDDGFTLIGTSGFHKVAGELRYEVVGGNAIVSGDVNGDGRADFSFTLYDVSSLAKGDFIL